jgi:uncharacterized protein YjbI with pentapeptide repeats
MFRTLGIKTMAKVMRHAVKNRGLELSHSDCLELVANQFGAKDWNSFAAVIGPDAVDKPLLVSVVGDEIKLHRTTQRLDVNDTDLSGSRFNDANLSGTSFNQINFSGAKFNDSNMTGWHVNDVNMSGSQFQNINLSGVTFSNCRMSGVELDGAPLEEMMAAYKRSQTP